MRQLKNINIYLLLLLIYSISQTQAIEQITINQSKFAQVKLAINFVQHPKQPKDLKTKVENIYQIISKDLSNTNLVTTLDPGMFLEITTNAQAIPHFPSWKTINTDLLLNITLEQKSYNNYQLSFYVWDIMLKTQVIKKEKIIIKSEDLRRVSHYISDVIYESITGYEGYFNSKIVYIAESGSYKKRVKKLAIMDYDGFNHEYLTDGRNLVSSPRFFPDEQKILYVSYEKQIPKIFVMDLQTKKSHIICQLKTISFAPTISPTGNEIIFSIAKDGQSHLYEYKIDSQSLKQITSGNHINTSPCYSPCGQYIIFNSNRNKKQSLFVMRRSDNKIFKITHERASYAEPKWSKQNWIAFTKIHPTLGFTIGILNIAEQNLANSEKMITTAFLVESPVWCHNGKILLFTKGFRIRNASNKRSLDINVKNLNRLYLVDVFGNYYERIINTPGDASDADWARSKVIF